MKRTQRKQLSGSDKRAVVLDPTRLSTARGGGDLGIAVNVPAPVPFEMRLQHNELLVTL